MGILVGDKQLQHIHVTSKIMSLLVTLYSKPGGCTLVVAVQTISSDLHGLLEAQEMTQRSPQGSHELLAFML